MKAAQEAAQRANAFLNAVLGATPDFTFVSDLAIGTIVYGSRDKDILGITGEPVEALTPAAVADPVHPDDQVRLDAVNVAAADLDDGQVLQVRYRGCDLDGFKERE